MLKEEYGILKKDLKVRDNKNIFIKMWIYQARTLEYQNIEFL